MNRTHAYKTLLTWTGNTGAGTNGYRSYNRSYELSSASKPLISGSSDPIFRGDAKRWNPEELLVGAISACHQLWFLHLCSDAGICVQEYSDEAEGSMQASSDGTAEFTGVVLRPRVKVPSHVSTARIEALHEAAHGKCVIAQSLRFRVSCEATTLYQEGVAST